ncbi:MAG: 1-deoxy-D-xylulose-5-phosphate reductoisomerase [Candidatus Omnitrophica bacterium]|nr:1-deoxy-D-xylulose-5-phosphate reductoisomerase [Candidatus Omnitrophota bacterium]
MKSIALLGSSGSIGESTLAVVRHLPERFRVVALSTHSNTAVLLKQIKEFRPLSVNVVDYDAARRIRPLLPRKVKLYVGKEGLEEIVCQKSIDQVLIAVSGAGALSPLLKAIEAKKEIALANKEALVMAGPLVRERARRYKVTLLPIDSEQSAIWQCLEGEDPTRLKTIYLTASGGPLRTLARKALPGVSIARVLQHPRWRMGKKITVDSATLMNKGLELLEAMALFGVDSKKVKVVIHPEAIVHSMVEFIDGVVMAQLSATDMRIPIQYALSYPQRIANRFPVLNFYRMQALHFQRPCVKRFPCLGLAYQAAHALGTMPCVLNAANEVCVRSFLERRISFVAIAQVVEKVMRGHKTVRNPGLGEIYAADTWARQKAHEVISRAH